MWNVKNPLVKTHDGYCCCRFIFNGLCILLFVAEAMLTAWVQKRGSCHLVVAIYLCYYSPHTLCVQRGLDKYRTKLYDLNHVRCLYTYLDFVKDYDDVILIQKDYYV